MDCRLVPLLVAAMPLPAEDGPWEGPQVLSILPRPAWGAVSGDFNGDGRLDLALVDGEARIGLFLQGPGGRADWRMGELPLGSRGLFLRAIDLDADGDPDLVAADPASVGLYLRCRGDGTFGQAERLPGVERPRWVAAGDWNGDRRVDLAAAEFDRSSISILTGDGQGGFTSTVRLAVGGLPHAIEAVDLDGDGLDDLAVKLSDLGILPLRARGEETFEPLPLVRGLGTDGNFLAGDFNGDSRSDLAVQCCSAGIGLGNGRFQETLSFPDFGSLAIADLDGNGKQDLVHQSAATSVLRVYPGMGDGSFGPEVDLGATGLDSLLLAEDLDGDGSPDLVGGSSAASSLVVIWGKGGGSLLEAGRPLMGFDSAGGVTVVDLDRDGMPDLLLPSVARPEVQVYLRPGIAGSSSPSRTIVTRSAFTSLVSVDLDLDGWPDLAGANRGTGRALMALLDPSGKPRSEAEAPAGALPSAVAAAHLDGGPAIDLAVLCSGSSHVALFRDPGVGGLGQAEVLPTLEAPRTLAAADADGDSRVDLAVLSGTELVVHYREQERWVARPVSLEGGRLHRLSDLEAADLDGDGLVDLLVLDSRNAAVGVLRGRGQRSFEAPAWIGVGAFPATIEAADLDRDGLLDISTANGDGQSVSRLFHRGDLRFEGRVDWWVGFRPQGHLVVDLDLDGALEVVAFKSHLARVLPGRPQEPTPGRYRRGDADGDGRVEINDPLALLERLFRGGAPLNCEDAADCNDDGLVELADPLLLLGWLFLGGSPPPWPGPRSCGGDPTADRLTCALHAGCP